MITYVAIHRKTGERRDFTTPSGLSRLSLRIWEYWTVQHGSKDGFEEFAGVPCFNHDLRKNRTAAVQRTGKWLERDHACRSVMVQIRPM